MSSTIEALRAYLVLLILATFLPNYSWPFPSQVWPPNPGLIVAEQAPFPILKKLNNSINDRAVESGAGEFQADG